jgi:tRNA(fMet)-specific endonuclease VapC
LSFLLDTDICSAYLRGNGSVHGRVLQYGGRLYISAITAGELFAWALRATASPKRWSEMAAFFRDVTTLPVDQDVALKFGELRAWQLDAGVLTPDLDLINAATALTHGLTMVTHNTRDYAAVPGLSLADWLRP